MAYDIFLKRTLAPLGIYELDSGYGADEISCEGAAMDIAYEILESVDKRRNIDTATTDQLSEYEELLQVENISRNTIERKNALKAILGMGDRCMSLKELDRILPACGVAATLTESQTPMTVEVSFTENVSDEELLKKLRSRIAELIPCHLNIEYV